MFERFEPLHLALSSSRRLMRVLGAIIQISTLSVLDCGKQLTPSDAVAPQFISYDHPRDVLQTRQQSLEESLCGVGIAPRLNRDVQHDSILIDGTPVVMLYVLDPDEHFVAMPLVSRPGTASTQTIGETCAEFLTPPSHCLVGHEDGAFSQDQFYIAQAETEHVVQPDSMADNLGGEPMTIVGIGRSVHALRLAHLQAGSQTWLP